MKQCCRKKADNVNCWSSCGISSYRYWGDQTVTKHSFELYFFGVANSHVTFLPVRSFWRGILLLSLAVLKLTFWVDMHGQRNHWLEGPILLSSDGRFYSRPLGVANFRNFQIWFFSKFVNTLSLRKHYEKPNDTQVFAQPGRAIGSVRNKMTSTDTYWRSYRCEYNFNWHPSGTHNGLLGCQGQAVSLSTPFVSRPVQVSFDLP